MRVALRPLAFASLVAGSLSLAACGSRGYVPLTADNIGSTMAAASKDLHSAHEVSTSGGVTSTTDFDTSGTLKLKVVRGSGADKMTIVQVGPAIYVSGGAVAPTGKWLKTVVASSAASTKSLDPVAMVAKFNKGMQKFTYVGPTKIDGVEAYHYRILIDQAKFLAAVGSGTTATNLGANESITEDLYLNKDNTLRRFTIAMPAGVGNARVDVTRWGQPVTITAPPASAVVTQAPAK